MAAVTDYVDTSAAEAREKRMQKIHQRLNSAEGMIGVFGLGFIIPLIKMALGDSVKQNMRDLWQKLFVPLMGIAFFVAAWAYLAPQVKTSLGAPAQSKW